MSMSLRKNRFGSLTLAQFPDTVPLLYNALFLLAKSAPSLVDKNSPVQEAEYE